MKKELMEIMACPLCKGLLELNITEDNGNEVIKGTLSCAGCAQDYPIEDAIPNLLPPQARG